jgi:hypothetical protein
MNVRRALYLERPVTLAGLIVLLLFFLIAYPRVRPVETYVLQGEQFFTSIGERLRVLYFQNSSGLKNFEITLKESDFFRREVLIEELIEGSSVQYNFRYQYSDKAVLRNSELVSAIIREGAALKKTDSGHYKLVRTDRIRIPEHVFEHEVMYESGPPEGGQVSRFPLHYSKNQDIRNIEFMALLAEDFSKDHSPSYLLNEVLTTVLQANQYLRPVGFNLVLTGVRIYREESPFTSSIQKRDPHQMLSVAVDQHHVIMEPDRQLTIVFSDTFFPRASGMSYTGTSCVNPRYSGIFVTRGGEALARQVTFPSTLAHEVGHYLGMGHDAASYPYGTSLMSPTTTMVPFGFSEVSVQEQMRHSGIGREGGSCFEFEYHSIDSDGDGVTDEVEMRYGSNPFDAGSHPREPGNEVYAAWNGFKNQVSIGETVSASALYGGVSMEIFDLNGNSVLQRYFKSRGFGQSDIIFNEHLPRFIDTYGIVKLRSNAPLTGRTNIYAHTGVFNAFNYVTTHPFFLPIRSNHHVVLPYNFHIPHGFTPDTRIFNWLSVINLSGKNEKFLIKELHHKESAQTDSRIVEVPRMGRRDILPGDNTHGFIKVYPLSDSEVPYHVFLSRYYQDAVGSLRGSVQVDGRIPSGSTQYLLYDPGAEDESTKLNSSQVWVELVNSSSNSAEVTMEIRTAADLISETGYILQSGENIHIPVPQGGPFLVSFSSDIPESLMVAAFEYEGQRPYSSVRLLPTGEALTGEFTGSWNTFLSTDSNLVIGNPQGEDAILSCTLRHESTEMHVTRAIAPHYIHILPLKKLYPGFPPDTYSPIRCTITNPEGALLPSIMNMSRLVDKKHRNSHLLN